MNINVLTQKSIEVISEYYKNNLEPYFNNIDDDILWIGPAKGQMLRGKLAILEAWSKEEHQLKFSMNSITTHYVTSSEQYCEIVLSYGVFTYYPDGHILYVDQILHYTWCNRRITAEDGTTSKVPKIIMIHISNSMAYDSRDHIYPVHFTEGIVPKTMHIENGNRILVRGLNQSTYYLLTDTIYWMESEDNGSHTRIHASSGELVVMETVSTLAANYPDFFIRIHISYLINPLFTHKLSRFQVEMTDGTLLPIPQKKYTRVKKDMEEWLQSWNARNS